MRTRTRRAVVTLGSGAVALALLLSGCTGGSGGDGGDSQGPVSQDEIDKALDTPTKLTFWTWVPDIKNEVALFEKKYPKIDVKVENVGSGLDEYTKLRTALKAGKGAPDVAQIEYQYISSFALTDSLLDLSPYGAKKLSGDYVEWVWNQVARQGKVYGIPQDSGPMGQLYRKDLFDAAGITTPPATWEDYAKAAATVKEKTGSYISNLPPNDPGQVVGLLWQAGVKPFGYDGKKSVTIDVNSPEAKEVLAYWQKLIQADLVSVDADFNDQWYQGFANDKYAGWITAAWGPVFLQGTAKNTSGKWRAAEMPQWEAGEHISGNWGGSSDAVLSTTDNPIAAYELAKWINHAKEPAMMFATKQFLFPTMTSTLEDPEFVDQKSEFYGGQQVNKLFAEISDTVDTKFEWLPYMDYAYSSFNEIVGKAISDKGDLSAALDAWQKDLVKYGKDQGFTVNQ